MTGPSPVGTIRGGRGTRAYLPVDDMADVKIMRDPQDNLAGSRAVDLILSVESDNLPSRFYPLEQHERRTL